MEEKMNKVKKVKGNLYNWFSHFIINAIWPCPLCKSYKALEIKSSIDGTWCWRCNKYVR